MTNIFNSMNAQQYNAQYIILFNIILFTIVREENKVLYFYLLKKIYLY